MDSKIRIFYFTFQDIHKFLKCKKNWLFDDLFLKFLLPIFYKFLALLSCKMLYFLFFSNRELLQLWLNKKIC